MYFICKVDIIIRYVSLSQCWPSRVLYVCHVLFNRCIFNISIWLYLNAVAFYSILYHVLLFDPFYCVSGYRMYYQIFYLSVRLCRLTFSLALFVNLICFFYFRVMVCHWSCSLYFVQLSLIKTVWLLQLKDKLFLICMMYTNTRFKINLCTALLLLACIMFLFLSLS